MDEDSLEHFMKAKMREYDRINQMSSGSHSEYDWSRSSQSGHDSQLLRQKMLSDHSVSQKHMDKIDEETNYDDRLSQTNIIKEMVEDQDGVATIDFDKSMQIFTGL